MWLNGQSDTASVLDEDESSTLAPRGHSGPRLLESLPQISGEVFEPAERRHVDLHMLAMLFHERQIEI